MSSYDLAQRRRLAWIAEQGGVCVKCGSTDRLEIDHIDRSTKTLNPYNIWHRRQEVRDEELAKCQVLCYECHKAKTRIETHQWLGTTDHGRTWSYTKGCRCSLCTAAWKEYLADLRERKRNGTFVDKRKR
jgi:5-methylcytosine-specific restriction endonuclease McrA